MTKEEARNVFLQKRLALSDDAYHQLNLQLYHVFFSQVDLSFIRCIHIFLSIEKKREPDTWAIIDRIRREFPHVRISVPKVVNDKLENFYFEGLHQLKKNSWGIWEPEQGIPTLTSKIDLVLVPLLAFDYTGHRVGYGKGYYDRFLKGCQATTQRIGISFFEPLEKLTEVNEFDVELTHGLTPGGIIKFNKD